MVELSDAVVRLQGVRKAFNLGQPSEVEVLHGIDLHLRAGEFCAVIGPSGSGKSTLLNIIGLLDRPTAGQLAVCGQETTALDDAALTRLRAAASASSSSTTTSSAPSRRSRT